MFRCYAILIMIAILGCSSEQPLTPEPQTIIVEVPCPEPLQPSPPPVVEPPPPVTEPKTPGNTEPDPPPPTQLVPDIFSISPRGLVHIAGDGSKVGRVQIGESLDAILNTDGVTVDARGQSWINIKHPILGLMTLTHDDTERVIIIGTADPRFKTDKLIAPGNSKQAVLDAYGNPSFWEDIGNFRYAFYEKERLAFGFRKGGDKIVIIITF